jgi:hypothetical protein
LTRLNITNGDSAAGTLSEAGVEGKIIPWRDVLHEGPVDSSLSLEELSKQRARFIAGRRWDDFAHVSGDFAERDRMIQRLDYFDEVVLWFEDDLYDQLQLIQLLDFFSRGAARKKTVSLIQVDGYIPPLSAKELKKLDESRARVTPEQYGLAQRAWKAFGSKDPLAISRLLDESTGALPYLASALMRHLEEFPEVGTGLSRSEREALTAIDQGHTTPVAAFLDAANKQESIFLGDAVFYSYLERLSGNKKTALVTWADGSPVVAPTAKTSRKFVKGQLKLTTLGYKVLGGDTDWQDVKTETRWLGGVEIRPGGEGWRWDPEERVVVRQAGEAAMETPKTRSKPPKTRSKPRKTKSKPRKTKSKPRKARPAAKKRKK